MRLEVALAHVQDEQPGDGRVVGGGLAVQEVGGQRECGRGGRGGQGLGEEAREGVRGEGGEGGHGDGEGGGEEEVRVLMQDGVDERRPGEVCEERRALERGPEVEDACRAE